MDSELANIIAERAASGDTTRDQVLKQELVRELLYTESGSLSVGQNLVGTRTMDRKSIEFAYPGEMTADYPVQMDTTAPRQRLDWQDFQIRLHRAHVRYGISDGAKLEGMGDVQMDRTRRRAAEALARRKDENILGILANGAYTENHDDSYSSGDEWNADSQDGQYIIDELWSMWKDIVINSPVASLDTWNMGVALPAEVYVEVNKLELINEIQQRIRDYLGQAMGFSLYAHKIGHHEDDQDQELYGTELQDTAIMVLPGSDTAIHGELSAGAAASADVPLVEQERQFGKGEQYIVSQWFNTAIMEHETGNEGESPRISVREGINAEV